MHPLGFIVQLAELPDVRVAISCISFATFESPEVAGVPFSHADTTGAAKLIDKLSVRDE